MYLQNVKFNPQHLQISSLACLKLAGTKLFTDDKVDEIARDSCFPCRKLSLKKGLTSLSSAPSGFERYHDEQGFVELSKNGPN